MSESKSDALDQLGEEGIELFGVPGETRTPTNGFGDRHAAITPPRHYITTLAYQIYLVFVMPLIE